MNNQAFATLEFDSLRALVSRHAQTEMGRVRVDTLEPIEQMKDWACALQAAGEMIALRHRGPRLSFEGLADPSLSISRLKIEGTALEPLAILDLARLCERAMEARATILAERDTCPTLFETVSALPGDLTKLASLLSKKILPSGELDDRASPELASIRRDISNARSRITRTLENLMRRSSEAVQEELVTIRNERFVIPVRSDHQGRIKGVTHGSSSSGATVFVEPLEIIEANNELQGLRDAEQREIAEILFALSEEVRRNLPGLEKAAEAIAELDLINAKAAFADKFNCVVPDVAGSADILSALSAAGANRTSFPNAAISDDTLEFINARHPLLEESLRSTGGHVVPVSFKLDPSQTTMVISGANAGGKTVVLKTTGLLALMALSGLPVPAREARVPFYRSILADIGDHQSLAANLSTFTSHVANIATMIDLCEPRGNADICPALVLLDEVGTGTDPEEGSALGVAVVDHFKRRGAHVLATTHYSGLKMYAASERGVLNASVEFDEKTLQPTYRLLVGIAGSSSGLEIAQRFGIPLELIDRANEQVKNSSRDAIEYLRRIKREADEAEALRRALEEERAAVADKFGALDRQFQNRERQRQIEFEKDVAAAIVEFEKRSRELIAKIQDRAERVKVEREAERRAAELKREAQRATQTARSVGRTKGIGQGGQPHGEEGGLPPLLRSVRVVRDGKIVSAGPKAGTTSDSALPEQPSAAESHVPRAIADRTPRVGDRVRLLTFGSIGIIDQIKGDEAQVRVGSLHMREKLEDLELVDDTGDRRNAVRSSTRVNSSLADMRDRAATTELHLHSNGARSDLKTSAELNLIGKKTDEAVEIADKFLDQAFLNGQTEVRIIHGHGTGALRRAISELLADHPHVARFVPAPPDQGGSGATLVEIRS